MMRAAIVIALASSGCSLGFGSAYVGQWRPHRDIVMESCRVDERGTCLEHKQVAVDVPERAFWGVDIAFPAMGVAVVQRGGMTETRMRLDPALEILRGHGSTAIGVRTGVSIDLPMGSGHSLPGVVMIPVDVLGHLSLSERFGIYGGLGYVPYSAASGQSTLLGGRAVAGMQFALGRDLLERYILLNVEASHTWLDLDSYHSTAVTANLGLYF